MNTYRPDIVFHAAAHKHVPFMELSPEEAVKNNVKGTETVADLAEKYRVYRYPLPNLQRSNFHAKRRCLYETDRGNLTERLAVPQD